MWCSAAVLVLAPPAAIAAPSDVEETPEAGPRVEVHGVVDVRYAGAGDRTSWLDGGVGRTRYGGRDSDRDGRADEWANGLHLGQLSLVVDGRLTEELRGHVHVNFDAQDYRGDLLGEVGVVEAFADWGPVLSPATRLRVRGGIVIPPFSIEHPERGWSTRYTITPSAIGSWIGEELKATGVEGTFFVTVGAANELQLQGGVFSANDTAGALLAWRGWALHDRQGQTGDELPLPPTLSLTTPRFFGDQGLRTEPFVEIDGRPGWWSQARLRVGARAMLQGGYWDSNGDVAAVEAGPGANYTWDTRFAVVGGELNVWRLNFAGQYMDGRAEAGFVDPIRVDAPFRSWWALAAIGDERMRLALRWDDFEVEDEDLWLEDKDLNREDGWAATAAWVQLLGEHHRLQVEYVRVHVERPFQETAGEVAQFTQHQVQVGYRLSF